MQRLISKIKKGRGFTLIELIIVIAILTILVLLAVPKLMSYTKEATYARIQNDAKITENAILIELVQNENIPTQWIESDNFDMTDITLKDRVFDSIGINVDPETIISNSPFYKLTESFINGEIKTRLEGDFVVDSKGNTYYINPEVLIIKGNVAGTNKPNSLEDENVITGVCQDAESLGFVFSLEPGTFIKKEGYENPETGYFDFIDVEYSYGKNAILEYVGNESSLVIPESLKVNEICYPVEHIVPYAFVGIYENGSKKENLLTSVEIPNTVKNIAEKSFAMNNLTSVKIGDSVTHIGEAAFLDNKLDSITIPDSVIYVGDYAFDLNKYDELSANIRGVKYEFKDLREKSVLEGIEGITFGKRVFDSR